MRESAWRLGGPLHPPRSSTGTWLKRLAALLALGMLFYRLANLELLPFILDEPQFLTAARNQLLTGHWASSSPIQGTQGAIYGPTASWFYGAVHWLFGSAPQTSALAMCLLVTLSHLALAVALTRLFREDALFLAVMLALIAASPYQFFWSRLAWDQTSNAGASCIVALLCLPGPLGWGRRVVLGLVLGLAISTHLMVLPLAALTCLVLAFEQRWRPRAVLATLGPVLACAALVNVPYLGFLRANPPHPPPVSGSFSWSLLGEHLLQPARVASTWEIGYFFDQAWPDFLQWVGTAGRWLLEHAQWSVFALIAFSGLGLLVTLGAKQLEQRRVAWLAVLCWLGYAAFYTYRQLNREPHYQFPTWWLIVVGVAGTLHVLRDRLSRGGGMLTGAVLLVACAQFSMNVAWMRYIRERGGTQGIHYSVPLSAQQTVVRRLCEEAHGQVFLDNRTAIFPQSLSYVAQTTPACQNVQLGLCGGWNCPQGVPLRTLRYAGPVGGAVVLE